MSDEVRNIQVKITTPADLSGLKNTAQATDELKGGTKNLTAEVAAAEGAQKEHNLHLENSRLLFTELNKIVPGLGHTLHAAFSGPLGPVIILAGAIEYLTEKIRENDKALDEAGEAAKTGEFAAGIAAAKVTMDEAAKSASDYSIAIGQIAQHEVTIAQALDAQLKLMHAIAAARAAEAKAAEERAKATTERKEKAGEITPEQAVISETAAAIKAAKDEAAAKKKTAADELAAKQTAFEAAADKQFELDRKRENSQEKFFTEKAHRERLEKDWGSPEFEKQKSGAQVELDKLQKEVDADEPYRRAQSAKARGDQDTYNSYVQAYSAPNITGAPTTAEKLDSIEHLRLQIRTMQMGQAQYAGTQTPAAQSQFETDKKNAEEADKKARENTAEVDRLRRELEEAKHTSAATEPINEQALADRIATILEQAVAKLYSQPRGSEVETGVHIADTVERGGKVNDAQGAFLMALDVALGGHAKTLKEAADHVLTFKDNTGAFFEAVIQLTTHGFTAQQKQIDALAVLVRQINNKTNNP